MAFLGRDPSPTPSVTSVMTDVPEYEKEVRDYVKSKLAKRMFLGHYQERRFVGSLRMYRDMVVLHSSEDDLKHDLMKVQAKLLTMYGIGKWIGITSPQSIGAPAAGYCLWVKLQDVAFGFYWFQIRSIRYYESEVSFHLRMIRPVSEEVLGQASTVNIAKSISDNVDAFKSRIRTSIHTLTDPANFRSVTSPNPDNGPQLENSPNSETSSQPASSSTKKDEENIPLKDLSGNSEPNSKCVQSDQHVITVTLLLECCMRLLRFLILNWKDFLKFLTLVLVGFGHCIHWVGEFSLKLLHEGTLLLRSITPIILAVIELVSKVVGGAYLLLAMMFSKNPRAIPSRQLMAPPRIAQPFRTHYKM